MKTINFFLLSHTPYIRSTIAIVTLIITITLLHAKNNLTTYTSKKQEIESLLIQKEKEYKIPTGLLMAIAEVESGRNDLQINHSGKLLRFKNHAQLKKYLRNNAKRNSNIDVGIMQLNIRYHSQNFKSFEEMLNIESNIDYAARFLTKLRKRHRSWWVAVGLYHNSNNRINVPYKEKVFQSWSKIKRRIMFARRA